ncbi:MAG: hypothetical protein JWM87_2590 [Candidatus Eremiobacteraeota bacterium]|nr:hypothetical protein [Candidatus Eremiobacteraeota bacterium]
MSGTDIVLVVCSEPYYRRYHLEEQPGIGQGATFESGMLNRRVLEAQGSQHGVIPIVFHADDVRWIPEFLRDDTRFVLPRDYDDLYRVLTDQPAYVPPPLGTVREMPSISLESRAAAKRASSSSVTAPRLAFFHLGDDGGAVAPLADFSREGRALKMVLAPRSANEASALRQLQNYRRRLGVAYNLSALWAGVHGFREYLREDHEYIEIDLVEDEASGYPMEMGYNSISADDIAVLRARRILLDEKLEARSAQRDLGGRLNDTTFEAFVSGRIGASLAVTGSPIPAVIKSASAVDDEVLAVARLMCVLMLYLTHTVERISKLDLETADSGVSVDFAGVRKRQYSNVAPITIIVAGVCPTSN